MDLLILSHFTNLLFMKIINVFFFVEFLAFAFVHTILIFTLAKAKSCVKSNRSGSLIPPKSLRISSFLISLSFLPFFFHIHCANSHIIRLKSLSNKIYLAKMSGIVHNNMDNIHEFLLFSKTFLPLLIIVK